MPSGPLDLIADYLVYDINNYVYIVVRSKVIANIIDFLDNFLGNGNWRVHIAGNTLEVF